MTKNINIWQKPNNEIFSKIEKFKLKYSYQRRWQSGSYLSQDFAESGFYRILFMNSENTRSAKFQMAWNMRSFGFSEPWAESPPSITDRVKSS